MKCNVAALVILPIATIFVLHSTVSAQPPATTTSGAATTTAAAGGKSVWDGVYTEEQAKRGGPMYSEYCASCHGPELMGGEMAPPLASGDFLSGWDGLTVGDLFERIRISMPQNAPGSLSGQQNADILAFMFSANKFPAGPTELSNSAMMLKAIKFEAKKPEKP
jgi:mono/diheme cytochrome c family protein